ncbi:catalase family protein [Paracoccus laeviglucosivorans]|uniref:Catalase n=1 Tax=Paracoccus laeviglucosivorans TaxID=1197861 RepID=A0A521FQK0_9RHOB|nr:catalase family protein [Paracoccus laeviglucosivorans]SMO98344.1 hypothetical protein SAMN06265221_13321 [Paracoccus laeviglucosivorans]
MTTAVRYSDALETVAPAEAETVRELLDAFDHILRTTARDYGHAVRSVHAKAHAVLRGSFVIDGHLPQELAQGLFAKGGAHDAWLRISTNPGDLLSDKISLPRGIALKVEDVQGPRLAGAVGHSQDFLMINGSVFASPTAREFARQLKLLAATTDRAEGGKIMLSKALQVVNKALGLAGLESIALAGLGGASQVDPLGETYFSATPFRYGDHVAKFRLRPLSPALTALTGTQVDTGTGENPIRTTIRAEIAGFDAEWAFEVQLARDLEKQPIEDASVEWAETDAPFVQVATLRVPRQDSWARDQVARVDEHMRFSPWNGLAAHRPLGGVNRARRLPYEQSAQFRAHFNRCPMQDLDIPE